MFTEIQDFTPQNQAGARCTFCGQHARVREGHRARTYRTPTHIRMEGWIEICEWCIIEAATKVGMVIREQAEELEALRETAEAHAETLLSELEEARAAIASLSREVGRVEDDRGAELDRTYKRGYDEGRTETLAELADAS